MDTTFDQIVKSIYIQSININQELYNQFYILFELSIESIKQLI